MTQWPEAPAIRAAIAWNETERRRALKDIGDTGLKVPGYAHKLVRGEKVALTIDEYRETRRRDAVRFQNNIIALKAAL